VDTKALIKAATDVRSQAHAPYSNYKVGAALLDDQGDIHVGCNVENASYGLTVCAERNAVFRALADGRKNFVAIAVVTEDGGFPCGACRQVLWEFAQDLQVIVADAVGDFREHRLVELLPEAFGG